MPESNPRCMPGSSPHGRSEKHPPPRSSSNGYQFHPSNNFRFPHSIPGSRSFPSPPSPPFWAPSAHSPISTHSAHSPISAHSPQSPSHSLLSPTSAHSALSPFPSPSSQPRHARMHSLSLQSTASLESTHDSPLSAHSALSHLSTHSALFSPLSAVPAPSSRPHHTRTGSLALRPSHMPCSPLFASPGGASAAPSPASEPGWSRSHPHAIPPRPIPSPVAPVAETMGMRERRKEGRKERKEERKEEEERKESKGAKKEGKEERKERKEERKEERNEARKEWKEENKRELKEESKQERNTQDRVSMRDKVATVASSTSKTSNVQFFGSSASSTGSGMSDRRGTDAAAAGVRSSVCREVCGGVEGGDSDGGVCEEEEDVRRERSQPRCPWEAAGISYPFREASSAGPEEAVHGVIPVHGEMHGVMHGAMRVGMDGGTDGAMRGGMDGEEKSTREHGDHDHVLSPDQYEHARGSTSKHSYMFLKERFIQIAAKRVSFSIRVDHIP
ncbi:unnamed protein product [Closterium sp. NIES-65]|nr:unnamed protein product [Closterium sp. NIES-65]